MGGPVLTRPGNSVALDRADRFYAGLMWLLPGAFRREYGAAMRQTFADLCAAKAARGHRLTPVLAQGTADLVGGAIGEWVATLCARDRWHKTAAAGLCVLAGLLVLYSQIRYPANLSRVETVAQDLMLVTGLAVLAQGFAAGTTGSARTLACAVATVPGWLGSLRAPLVGIGYVAALILLAAVLEARRAGRRYAGLRAGMATGTLAGITVLVLSLGMGILGMGRLLHDPDYHAGYLRSGQPDLAAYIIDTRICGSAIVLAGCIAAGALLGLVGSIARPSMITVARPP
jgi:hypothetical protein